eukprot:5622911-Pyramimonas_sp.AAC.2
MAADEGYLAKGNLAKGPDYDLCLKTAAYVRSPPSANFLAVHLQWFTVHPVTVNADLPSTRNPSNLRPMTVNIDLPSTRNPSDPSKSPRELVESREAVAFYTLWMLRATLRMLRAILWTIRATL